MQSVMNDWLAGQSMEEKLKQRGENTNGVVDLRLFRDVQKDIGMICPTEEQRGGRIELLRERYREDDYAKVRRALNISPDSIFVFRAQADSVLDGEPQRDVSRCQCSLVIKKSADCMANGLRDAETDLGSANQPPYKIGKRSIELRSLFDAAQCGLKNTTGNIRTVSIVGCPGSGKTTLSRKLAFDWANGNWGNEFCLVYVVPVRELGAARCHCGTYAARSLEAAIARVCFPYSSHACHEPLLTQIAQDLAHAGTLLVLDGLDEADDAGKDMIRLAKRCSCNMILLSRHSAVEEEREAVDIEVECLGLTSNQLRDFFVDELAKEDGEMLMQWVKSNPVWGSIARVPVVAHILCILWKESKFLKAEEGKWSRRFELCENMSAPLWSSHLKKSRVEDVDRSTVFSALERIAFEALTCGDKLISHALLEKAVENGRLKRLLKRCGLLQLRPAKNKYQFLHNDFLEFFAGKFLAQCMCGSEDTIMSKVEEFISDSAFFSNCKGVRTFALQEICQRNHYTGLINLMAAVDYASVDVIGFQNLLLKLEVIETALTAGTQSMRSRVFQSPEVKAVITSCAELLKCWIHDKDMIDLLANKLGNLKEVVGNFPQLLNPSIEELQDHSGACFDALPVFAKLGKHSTKVHSVIVRLLSEGIHSGEVCVRRNAIGNIPAIVAALPELRDELICILLRGCSDTSNGMELDVAEHLPALLRNSPESAKKALDVLLNDDQVDSMSEPGSIIEKIAEAEPDVAVCCLEQVCKNYGDKTARTCAAAMALISPVIDAFPERSKLAFNLLHLGCHHGDCPGVRCAALRQIARLKRLKAKPKEAAWQLLIQACNDDDGKVSEAAVESILDFIQHDAEYAKKFVSCFLQNRNEQSGFNSPSAMNGVINLLQNMPGLADTALKILSMSPAFCIAALEQIRHAARNEIWGAQLLVRGCRHEFRSVRSEALRYASVIADKQSLRKGRLLKILKEATGDPENEVRRAAVSQIGRVAGSGTCSAEALQILKPLCKDKDENVHTTAYHQLAELVLANPQLEAEVLGVISRGCSSMNGSRRRAAVAQICAVVVANPKRLQQALSLISKRVEDQAWLVRAEAFAQIPQILHAAPQILRVAPECLETAKRLLTLAQKPGERSEIRNELVTSVRKIARELPREAALLSKHLNIQLEENTSDDVACQEEELDAISDTTGSLCEASDDQDPRSSSYRSRSCGTSAWWVEKPSDARLQDSCFVDLVDQFWNGEDESFLHAITLKVLRATITSAGNSRQRLMKLRASLPKEDGDEIERSAEDISCLLIRVKEYLNDKYDGFSLILP